MTTSLSYSGRHLGKADDPAPKCGFTGATDFLDDASGSLLQRTDYRPKAASGLPYSLGEAAAAAYDPAVTQIPWVTDTVSYCGPFEYQNGALSRVSFPGGYVRGDSAYH